MTCECFCKSVVKFSIQYNTVSTKSINFLWNECLSEALCCFNCSHLYYVSGWRYSVQYTVFWRDLCRFYSTRNRHIDILPYHFSKLRWRIRVTTVIKISCITVIVIVWQLKDCKINFKRENILFLKYCFIVVWIVHSNCVIFQNHISNASKLYLSLC